MKTKKKKSSGCLSFILAVVIIAAAIMYFSEPDSPNKETEGSGANTQVANDKSSDPEKFADENNVSEELAQSLETVLVDMKLTDKSKSGVFHYDLSDVYNFERIDDWAYGKRYKMWMDMEHVWYAYTKGDVVVGVRDGNGNIFYQSE